VRVKLKDIEVRKIARHRNGISGEPFYVIVFDGEERCDLARRPMIATVFDTPKHVSVLDRNQIAAGEIDMGTGSWRGDEYEDALREAIAAHERLWEAGKLGTRG